MRECNVDRWFGLDGTHSHASAGGTVCAPAGPVAADSGTTAVTETVGAAAATAVAVAAAAAVAVAVAAALDAAVDSSSIGSSGGDSSGCSVRWGSIRRARCGRCNGRRGRRGERGVLSSRRINWSSRSGGTPDQCRGNSSLRSSIWFQQQQQYVLHLQHTCLGVDQPAVVWQVYREWYQKQYGFLHQHYI